jgi:hypothetical protein
MKATDIYGFMNDTEIEQISTWAKKVPKNGVIVEIGSFFGKSAIGWASACDPSVTVYCIDVFMEFDPESLPNVPDSVPKNKNNRFDTFEIFKENTKDIKNIYPIKARNIQELPDVFTEIDVLFIDASHKNPSDLQYILYFTKFIKPGGLICGHDYSEEFPDVKFNVSYLENRYKTKAQIYHKSSLWSIVIQ